MEVANRSERPEKVEIIAKLIIEDRYVSGHGIATEAKHLASNRKHDVWVQHELM